MEKASSLENRHLTSQEQREQLEEEIAAAKLEVEIVRAQRESALSPTGVDAELQEAEMKLLSLQLRQEASRLRDIEQALKQNIDWYTPLEDVLGVPVIGVNVDTFIASIENNEDIIIKINEITGVRPEKSLSFEIRPEHIRHQNIDSFKCLGAGVSIYVLPDRTLRPQAIYDYDKIFPHNSDDRQNAMHIKLVGSFKKRRHSDWRETNDTMSVSRYKPGYVDGRYESGATEVYDTNGQLVPKRTYDPDHSGELS